jgi:hypothetical protein
VILNSSFDNIIQMIKKRSVLIEAMKDKHDKLFCLVVKDKKIFSGEDVPLEFGDINMKKRIARVLSIWLFFFFNVISLLIIDSTRFNHSIIFGGVESCQLGEINGFNCRKK